MPVDDTPKTKNPDAYLIDEQIVVEFKHYATPTASNIENEARDAKRQADYILLHLKRSILKELLIEGLRQHIHRAVDVKQVWLIF
jgi:hypothetical protein